MTDVTDVTAHSDDDWATLVHKANSGFRSPGVERDRRRLDVHLQPPAAAVRANTIIAQWKTCLRVTGRV